MVDIVSPPNPALQHQPVTDKVWPAPLLANGKDLATTAHVLEHSRGSCTEAPDL